MILSSFEEQLLDMPFEIMLVTIVNLPQKYLCQKLPDTMDVEKKREFIQQESKTMDK